MVAVLAVLSDMVLVVLVVELVVVMVLLAVMIVVAIVLSVMVIVLGHALSRRLPVVMGLVLPKMKVLLPL